MTTQDITLASITPLFNTDSGFRATTIKGAALATNLPTANSQLLVGNTDGSTAWIPRFTGFDVSVFSLPSGTRAGAENASFTTRINNLNLTVTGGQITGWIVNATYWVDIVYATSQTAGAIANYVSYFDMIGASAHTTNPAYGTGVSCSCVRSSIVIASNDYVTSRAAGYWIPAAQNTVLYGLLSTVVPSGATITSGNNCTVTITRIL